MKELADTSVASSANSDPIDGLINMLQKLKSTPDEMEAMLELEYGPVFEYYWMAYSSLIERENYRDRELAREYVTRMGQRVAVYSTFENEMVTFSDLSIEDLKEKHRDYLEGKGLDLTKTDRRVVE
jgi:hypothetical protein